MIVFVRILRSEPFCEHDDLSSLPNVYYPTLIIICIYDQHDGLQQRQQLRNVLTVFFFFSFYVQRTQHSCVSAMRLTSIALWLAALVGLIVSGNGEANVCRPLYDEPAYETITKIMDSPTVTSERGFFSWFVLGNDTSPAPFDEVIE